MIVGIFSTFNEFIFTPFLRPSLFVPASSASLKVIKRPQASSINDKYKQLKFIFA
jgi:hypothetical protein